MQSNLTLSNPPLLLPLAFFFRFGVRNSIAVAAEWKPSGGEKWEEKDFEAELKKLEKEAEDRLDAKIAEMISKVETTGAN